MNDRKNLENEVQSTGFWLSKNFFQGPINSGRDRLTEERKVIAEGVDTKYSVSKNGKILDPQGKETGYFFDISLHLWGPKYGTLPWMKETAKPIEHKIETPADYGMKID